MKDGEVKRNKPTITATQMKAFIGAVKSHPLTYKKGESVTWKSQAAGHVKKKTGLIVGIVPADKYPNQKYGKVSFKKRDYERFVFGVTRDHRSYVVNVNGKLYYPLVKYLKVKA